LTIEKGKDDAKKNRNIFSIPIFFYITTPM